MTKTNVDCPICNNPIQVEKMVDHILSHFEKECKYSEDEHKKNQFVIGDR